MRKTLQDVAIYLKEIRVPEAKEAYEISPVYTNISNEESIYDGVTALRIFLGRLYDVLSSKSYLYDNSKKVAHEYENRTTLSVYYPFLHNVSSILIKAGYYGTLDEEVKTLSCKSNILSEKIAFTKTLECLQFLSDCGLNVEGVDLHVKKQNIANIDSIKISYIENPMLLIGMKIMSIAEIDYSTLINQDVFLRCNYKILKKEETNPYCILKDTIAHLSIEIQDFVLQLHSRYLNQGLSCVVEVKGFHIYIKYCYKRKDLWGINASLNNGYHINVKSIKTEEYADTIQSFSPVLQKLIAKGYGCGRKRDVGHCDGGCRGITIPLDDSVLVLQDDITTWFDKELSFLRKK